jgi:hypothetical protein
VVVAGLGVIAIVGVAAVTENAEGPELVASVVDA